MAGRHGEVATPNNITG